jgi:SAM-dependent MidA family methyltransferase
MDFKLYDSIEGYYSNFNENLWKSDYFTSPMTSPAFGCLFARYIYSSWIQIGKPKDYFLVEIGGGGLYFITNIIKELAKISNDFLDILKVLVIDRNFYNTIDPEHHLNLIKSNTFNLKNIDAFVISNELYDAIPFKRLIYKDNGFFEILFKHDNGIKEKHEAIDFNPFLGFDSSVYAFEDKIYSYSHSHNKLVKDIYNGLNSGIVVSIDYGYTFDQLYEKNNIHTDARIIRNQNITDDIYAEDLVDISSFVNFDLLEKYHLDIGFNKLFLGKQSDFLTDLGIHSYAKNYYNSDEKIGVKSKNLRTMQDLIDDDIFGDYLILGASKGFKGLSHKTISDYSNKIEYIL